MDISSGMESVVQFANEGETLYGVLHEPERPNGIAVVFLHGWPGNRIGPHRMFVTFARRLETLGFTCLRLDFRGRGDSEGSTQAASIRGMIVDVSKAADFMLSRPGLARLYLLGICSGGKVAVGAAAQDPRIRGLALWSAEAIGNLRSRAAGANKSAKALRTYARKLMAWETWKKIITLRVNTRMVRKAIVTDEKPRTAEVAEETALLDRFRAFKGPVQFIFGGNDPDTRFAAEAYTAFCKRHGIRHECHEVPGANHSFYSMAWKREVTDLTERWFRDQAAADGPARP
jgi:pimeloyl-ACP methyl ester carboxylesterase